MVSQVLFENKFYRATFYEAIGDQVAPGTIVFFDSRQVVNFLTGRRKFRDLGPENFITKAGFRAVIVAASRNDWYTHRSADLMAKTIGRHLHGTGPILSYGTSMGGFGAIAHSGPVGANLFFAASPSASKLPAYLKKIGDPRVGGKNVSFHRDTIRNGKSQNQRGIVAYDPMFRDDLIHARTILRMTRGIDLKCPATGHFSMLRVNREIGFRNAMKQVFDRIDDDKRLKSWIAKAEAKFNDGLGARFIEAGSAGRDELLNEHGAKVILSNVHESAIIEDFDRNPSEAKASILIRLLDDMHENAAANAWRAIVAAELEHMLT